MLSRFALALMAALSAGVALADEYTIRVPVATATSAPAIQTIDYGSVNINTTVAKTLTYKNTGSQAVTLGVMALSGKAVTLSANGCASGVTVAAGQSCTFKVTVNPTAMGRWDTAISLPIAGMTAAPQFIVRAFGVAPSTVLLFDRSSVDFGGQTLLAMSAPQALTLKNVGTEEVTVSTVRLGENSSYFNFDGSDCERTLAPQDTCKVTAALTPRTLGAISARVLVELEDGTYFQGASLTGYGVQGVPTFSASKINFIGVRVGTTSTPQTLTLSNNGTGSFGVTSLGLSGDSSFKMASNDCGKSVAPGGTCTMSFTVTPDTADIRTATVALDASGVATQVSRVYLFSQPAVAQGILEVSPTSLAFGDVALGSNATLGVTLRSTGTLPVVVSQYSFAGAGAAQYSLVNPTNCIGTLNVGQQCTLQVRVAPKVAGPLPAATLSLATDLTTPVAPLELSATGLVGTLTVAPTSLSFVDVQAGKSATQALTLTNTGTAALTIGQRTVSPVTLSVAGCEQATLAPNASCVANVTYTPVGAGTASGTLTFPSNGAPSSLAVPVSMTATPAPTPKASLGSFSCLPTPTQTGKTATCTATLTNTGTVPVAVSALARTGTVFSAPSATCGTSVAVGASCTVTTSVTSSVVGSQSSTITVTTDAGLLSSAVAADFRAAAITLLPQAHGVVQVGASNVRAHTVSNLSPFPVTLNLPATLSATTGLSLGGTVSGTACVNGAALSTGQSCVIATTCAPATATALSSTLSVASSANTVTGAVTCTGEYPPVAGTSLAFTPNPLDWGNVPVGTSASQSVTLTNKSAAPLTVTAMTLGGTSAADFSVATNGCIKTLAAGSSCQVTLQAKPSAPGTEAATLSVSANTSSAVTPLTMRVTGAQANLTLAPSTANFGTVQVGQTGSATFVVGNTGTGPASLTGLSFGGTDPSRFSRTGGTCTVGSSLNAGSSCSFNVTFTPTAAVVSNADVRLTFTGAAQTALSATLTGTGAPAPAPLLVSSLGNDCQSHVQYGQTAPCTVTLANNGTTAATVTGYTVRRKSGDFSTGIVAAPRTLTNARAFTVLAGGASINAAGALVLPAGASAQLVDVVNAVATSVASVDSYFNLSGVHVNSYAFVTAPTVTVSADASHFVDAPSLAVTTTTPDLAGQAGDSRTAVFTLTNQGIGPVKIGTPTVASFQLSSGSSIFRVAASPSNSCVAGQTLGSGQSCQAAVVCSPVVGSLKSAGNIVFAPTVQRANGTSSTLTAKGALTCTPSQPSGVVSAVSPGRTAAVATGSQSGNWLRFTNTGAGPLTVTGMTADPQTVFYTDPTNSSHCAVNRVVASGASCDFLEIVTKLNPTSTPVAVTTRTSVLRTNLLTFPLNSSYSVTGLAVTADSTFGTKLQKGDVRDLVLTVQNTTPSSASGFTFVPSQYAVVKSNTCSTVAPNASCTVTLTLSPPTTLTTTVLTASLRVDAKFERLYNMTRYPATVSSQGGSWTATYGLTTPSATLKVTNPADTNKGSQTTATATFTNTGQGALNVKNPLFVDVSAGGAAPYSVAANGCTTPVQPGASCTMTLAFAPQAVGTFTAKFGVTSEATTTPGQVSAKALGPDVQPWRNSVGVCGGWGWGFDQNGDLQCNIFGVSKWRTVGYVNTSLTDAPGKASPYYLAPPATWDGTGTAKAKDIYTYRPDISMGCGYYDEMPRTRKWSDRQVMGPGPIFTASNGVKYSFAWCTGHDTPPYSTINIVRRSSLIVSMNPDGSLRYVAGFGGADTSRLPQPYDDMGAAFDEARDTLFLGGLNSGESSPYTGTIYQVQASTGKVVKSWPTSQFGSVFAYDRVTGDLYFGQGTYYFSGRGAVTATQLLRVNPYTGVTASFTLPRSINLARAGHRIHAHNGKVYLLEVSTYAASLVRIDTTVTPVKLDELATGGGFNSVTLSNNFYLTVGGPGDNSIYAPALGVRVPLN